MIEDEDSGAQALWIQAPGRAVLRPATARPAGAGEVRVRALTSGISRGTESLVFHGKVPPSEWQRMRCPWQEGEFPFPVKYGYAIVGVTEDGERVLCLHPHQSRFTVSADAVLAVPSHIPSERAVLAPQLETAINATWDAGPRAGDRIAVVGGGVIGSLVAYLCARSPGAEVTLIDSNPARQELAAAFGVGFAQPGGALPADCDLVFHATGRADGLNLALSLAGFEATVVELSWYGTEPVSAEFGGAFHSRRLSLRSSQVGAIPAERRGRWDFRRRLALALGLTADPALDLLVQDETPFEHIPALLPTILGAPGPLFHRIRY